MASSIVVTSAVLPPITIDIGGALEPGSTEQPSLLLRILKPRITLNGPGGGDPLSDSMPAGAPGNTWPLYTVGAGVIVVAILALAIRGATK